jgi:ubiquinone/menaquinone biosynthesis C-methylase UbiE
MRYSQWPISMDPHEYAALARVERRHWFYSGKREIVRYWIDRLAPLTASDVLVDVGAGTGLFAEEMTRRCCVIATDAENDAIKFIRERAGILPVAASATSLPIVSDAAAALTALDVIEHLDDDAAALHEFVRVVRPGGIIVLTVPALPWLWSEWDEALHHRRRYTARSLNRVVSGLPAARLHLSYINTLALLPIVALRAARRAGVRLGSQRPEDVVPPEPLNSLLRLTFVRPALSRLPMPAGVSLLCILRKHEAIG